MENNYLKYSEVDKRIASERVGVLRFLTKILIPLFVFSSIMMPRDNFNIKISLWVLLLIISIPTIVYYARKRNYLIYSFYVFVYPIYLIIISLISHQDLYASLSAVYVFSYLLLIFICTENKINYTAIFINTLTIMSVIITLSGLLDIVGIIDIYQNPVLTFLSVNGEAQISKSSNAICYYVLFLKASPLLLVHFTYNLHNKNFLITTLSFIAILFSGTRANIFLSLLVIVFHFYFIQKNNYIKIFFTFFLVLSLMFFGADFYDKVDTINNAKSIGDKIRSTTKIAIFEEMNIKPTRYLIGMGFGSEYYSLGRGRYVSTSELSYYELIRQVGIIGAIPFLYFILKPIKLLYRRKKWLFISYMSNLVVSWVDPLLFTSTAFMLYALVYFNYEEIKGGR
jgi:hypothetical protein